MIKHEELRIFSAKFWHLEDSSSSDTHSPQNVKKNKETKNLEHQIKILSTHLASILLIFEDAQGRK